MSTSKSICCWPASRPCMEETMDCHLRYAASWKHSGKEIRSVSEDRVKESSEILLPKLDKWLRSSGFEQERSVSRNILQTGSGQYYGLPAYLKSYFANIAFRLWLAQVFRSSSARIVQSPFSCRVLRHLGTRLSEHLKTQTPSWIFGSELFATPLWASTHATSTKSNNICRNEIYSVLEASSLSMIVCEKIATVEIHPKGLVHLFSVWIRRLSLKA